jgi:hypothetical protein
MTSNAWVTATPNTAVTRTVRWALDVFALDDATRDHVRLKLPFGDNAKPV